MATYPEEGKVTHPDDVGKRRMPARQTKVAGAETHPSVVKYGGRLPGDHDPEVVPLGRDLGNALKAMKMHRENFPDSPVKMDATYE